MNDKAPFWIRLRRAPARLFKRISRLGRAIISPFERAVMGFLGALFAFSERFEDLETFAGRIVQTSLWPFRFLWQLLTGLLKLAVPNSARQLLAAPFYVAAGVARRLGSGLMRAAELVNLDRLVLVLVKLSRPLWYPLAAIGTFTVVWAATRPYKKLLWGLPAVLLMLPVLVATTWGALLGKETIAARYRLALARSLEQKDYPVAALLERKLSGLGINTKLSEFNTAQALGTDGKFMEAYERMQRLAPVESPGYPLAHLWIIQTLLSNKLNLPAGEVHRLTGIHLKHLSDLGAKGPEIDLIRAAWLTQDSKLEEAAALLKPLVHSYPSAAIERFRINLALRHIDQARLDAQAVHEQMDRQRENANFSNHNYESWVAAEQLLGDHARSREILREWLKRYPDNESARKYSAAMNLQEFDEILSSPAPKPEELSARIRAAFALADASDNMKQRVALLYQQRAARPELRALFEQLAKSDDLSSSLAETLGTAAGVYGEWDQAQVFLEQAVKKDATNAVAWNNLACALLQKQNAPPDKALSAANKALELKPDDFRFRETRGEILLRFSRWHEAVDDLEYALNGLPDNPAIHQALGKAYDALGNKELAAAHRQYAN
jgi:tetratricopeptide (TPR) repeat protein